ncbi:MAG: transposase, partial [Sedimentitalea sp.]|uniref:transposase n=1 Tax=Sedimentitalea sp. TaxID=2048915 RepID=UPI003265D2C4
MGFVGQCCRDRTTELPTPLSLASTGPDAPQIQCGASQQISGSEVPVTNWPEHTEALQRRGDLYIWFDEEAVPKWSARRRIGRSGQARYSDFAIEICPALRLVFHQPLRQVQGMVRSLMRLLGLSLPVPDFSTLSRRGKGLHVLQPSPEAKGPITLIVDSTGLSIHRGSGWNETKHGAGKTRKSWRKLHVG